MKTKIKHLNTVALAAALVLVGVELAPAADTNATTVAYWQMGGAVTDANAAQGYSIPDLGTNVGQGTLTGVLPNLWVEGPNCANATFASDVPPSSLFNANHYFGAGLASWDVGADEYSSSGVEIECDNIAFGNLFDAPSFTEEVIFKTDYANDPTLGTVKQTLVWNHQNSAYCHLQLNESADGNTNNIGSLLFWGWNGDWPTVRITAVQNGGQRLDDGHWHYAAARYNGATLTIDLLVVNEDGSMAESSAYLGKPLNPGGSGSQGPLIIGNDEGGNTPLDGRINQVRFSSVSLPVSQLLAKVASCATPVFASSPTTNGVAVGSFLDISPAFWPVQMEGGPLQLQWQCNGANVAGQTNLNFNMYPVSLAAAGTYQLIASTPCGGLSVTSAPVTVQVSPSIQLARWGFNFTEANTFPQATVDDLAANFLNVYDLITLNNSPNISGIGGNGEIPLTSSVPPTTMFINGNNGGTNAFDCGYLGGNDGVVFYPLGPDVFDFRTSFSLELFFKTYGDQSANGPMELICQGTDGGNTFRYGVNLNQAAPGGISFGINNFAIAPVGPSYEDTNAGIQSVVLKNANYADGNWHYLLAQYNSISNTISLKAANTDGTGTNATVTLPTGYGPLTNYVEGNLFVGRMRYSMSDDHRNFVGAIDEVQVSQGLVTPGSGQLGFLPGGVITPQITGISVSGGTVTIKFTGSPADAASAFTLVGSSTVHGTYSALSANIASLGSGSFQATIATSGSAEFYRIKR